MPKIIIVVSSLRGGGAERVTVALSAYLVSRGHRLIVVTLASRETDFYSLRPGVRRISLSLAEKTRRVRKLTVNFERARALRRILTDERPDVVIGMMTTSAVLAILAARGLPTRVIASERIFPGSAPLPFSWTLLRKLCYRFADAHVAQTHAAAEWIIRYAAAKNVRIIPNAVSWPIAVLEPVLDPQQSLSSGHHVLLAAGRGERQKGFDLLVHAFSRIAPAFPSWHLVILGPEGDARQTLTAQALSAGIADRIFLPGRVGNIGDWFSRADIFVLSSRFEGFPNVLLEAMAANCCCVAFDCVAGPSDIITDRVNGLLVPPEDVAALSESMAQAMNDALIRERLAREAGKVREVFSHERVFRQWEGVIGDLTKPKTVRQAIGGRG